MYILLATILVFLFTLLFVFNWQKHSYWKSRGVPTPPTLPLIGHLHKIFWKNKWIIADKIYKKYKSVGYWGMYECFKPTFYVSDPALLRAILVKDSEHFIDRRSFNVSDKEKVFKEMLHIQHGEKWKALRSLTSPTFTSGKIKAMYPLISSKCEDLATQCEKEMNNKNFVEMRSLLGYYTMDVIGTCAFGIEANCLEKKDDSLFVKNANKLSAMSWKMVLRIMIAMISTKLFHALRFSVLSEESMKFFVDVVGETAALREKSGQKRGDFLDLMLEALDESNKNESRSNYPVTMNTVLAQSILFLLAGFDTTANSISFVMYLLAKNPQEQDRLRKELAKLVEVDGELNYQNVMEAEFLDACVSESLRMYSPGHILERACTKQYNVPGTDIILEEGIIVDIPTWSLHYDPEYWEEPETFQPDRFLPENKDRITPYTYMPFGMGPRNCIGMRFALLETKLAIAKLILDFEIALRPGFQEIILDTSPGTLRPNKDGVQLTFKKIDQ